MASVGPGAREIRIQTELAHRVFYVATFDEAVYVLHAFREADAEDAATRSELGARSIPRIAQETS